MSFLRIAAVIIGLVAVPVLFASAETLSARARVAERNAALAANAGEGSGRLVAAKAQDMRSAEGDMPPARDAAVRRQAGGAPTFARIVIDPDGASSFEGLSAPGAEVTLILDARLLGKVRADPAGIWRLTVAQPMAAGDHNITSSSTSADQSRAIAGQEVRIAIPDAMVGAAVVAYEARPEARPENSAELRLRAEDLAAAASQKFTEIVPSADGARLRSPSPDIDRRDTGEPTERRLAQAPAPAARPGVTPQAMPPAVSKELPAAPGADGIAAPVFEWLERSAREYQGTVVKGLSGGRADTEKSSRPADTKTGSSKAASSPSGPIDSSGSAGGGVELGAGFGDAVTDAGLAVQEWLARANRSYQTEVVRKLEQPAAGSAGAVSTRPSPVAGKSSAETSAAKMPAADSRSVTVAEDAAAKAAAAEAEARRADETRRLEDERRRVEATQRAAAAADKSPSKPIEQVAPMTPPADAAQQTAADEAKRKRVAEEAARKDADAARQKAAEAQRQKDEATKKQAEEIARQRTTEEARLRAAEAKRLEDARVVEAEGEARRAAAAKSVDMARKAIDAARSAPAKRAAEKQIEAEPGKGQAAPARTDVGAKLVEQAPTAKSTARPRDTRIAEGSGEKGPVDKPPPPRGKLDRSARSGLGVEPPANVIDRAAKAGATQSRQGRTCGRAGREITPPGTYVVAVGDTLSEIAERHYGTARRMGRIVKANRRKIGDPDLIRPCQRIYLP